MLSLSEQAMLINLASDRSKGNRNAGFRNSKISPEDYYSVELRGLGGAYTFCKEHEISPDPVLQQGPRRGSITVTSPHGYRVNIKTTKYENGRLLSSVNASQRGIDVYALMIGEFPDFRFVGWEFADKVRQEENRTFIGRSENYALEQHELKKEGL